MREILGIALVSVITVAGLQFISRQFAAPSAFEEIGNVIDRILFPTEPE